MKSYVYQSSIDHQLVSVFSIAFDGWVHALGFSDLGNVCRHWVLDKSDFGLIKDIPKPLMAVWNVPVSVVPAQFIGVKPPESNLDSMVTLNDDSFLCYRGKNRQHLFQAYMIKAQAIGLNHQCLVFFWNLNDCLYISVFESGKLLFANIFDVTKKEEIVYFVLAAARDCGFDAKPFTLLGDADENLMNELYSEFEKMDIELTHLNRDSIYPGCNDAPSAHVANLLSFLVGCDFPRDYN